MSIKFIRFILKTAFAVGASCSVVPRLLFYGLSCCQERTRPAGSNSSPDGHRVSPGTTTAQNKSRGKAPTATAVFRFILCGALLLDATCAYSAEFPLPPAGSNMVGHLQVVLARHQDTLLDIARHYDVGYNEIRAANPGVDPWLPGAGTRVLVPTEYVLPPKPWQGIIINIPARRLFYFPADQKVVYTFPVGIFRPNWPDPVGSTKIIAKVKNPTWTVPKNIQEEHAKAGEPIPAFFPAGPNNPMGELALETGWSQIFIHGTNKPWGVGMRVSHGCFHVYPENEVQLFKMVKVGTPVRTIDQPYVVGSNGNGNLYLQSFEPVEAYHKGGNNQQRAVDAITAFSSSQHQGWTINWQRVINLVQKPNTVPVAININTPDLQVVADQLSAQPYDFAPYGDNANTATPPPAPVTIGNAPKS